MKELEKSGIDHFRSSGPERTMFAGTSNGGQTAISVRMLKFRHFASWIVMCAAGLLVSLLVIAAPLPASAEVAIGISVGYAPPALPVYVQPVCPGPGFIWIPGYWAWDPDYGYYWVPGTWVLAPFPGFLWTPGYWAWSDGAYIWYEGYWGPVVGFYGGINYGFGYNGYGYYGGYWDHDRFYYNRTVNNISTTNITTVYSKQIPRSATKGRVSFNGGRGGAALRPTAGQMEARKKGSAPVPVQREQLQAARSDPRLRASANHGRPAIAATPKPGVFSGSGVVHSTRAGAPYKAPSPGRTSPTVPRERSVKPGEIEKRQPTVTPRHEAPVRPETRPNVPRVEPRREQTRPEPPHPQVVPHQAPEAPMRVPQSVAPHPAPERREMVPQGPRGGEEREEGRPR